jgi:hypothetical protein
VSQLSQASVATPPFPVDSQLRVCEEPCLSMGSSPILQCGSPEKGGVRVREVEMRDSPVSRHIWDYGKAHELWLLSSDDQSQQIAGP